MLRNKKLLIIISLSLAIVLLVAVVYYFFQNKKLDAGQSQPADAKIASAAEPEFMSTEEKKDFGLPVDSKIQVLKKDEQGKAEVYRVIRREADVVVDPSRVGQRSMTGSLIQKK